MHSLPCAKRNTIFHVFGYISTMISAPVKLRGGRGAELRAVITTSPQQPHGALYLHERRCQSVVRAMFCTEWLELRCRG